MMADAIHKHFSAKKAEKQEKFSAMKAEKQIEQWRPKNGLKSQQWREELHEISAMKAFKNI